MKLPAILSTVAAGLCLVLSVWLFSANHANQSLQLELQAKQQDLQTQQQQVQLQQQQFQAQQQKITQANQISQQVGPAVFRDLGSLALQNKNENIKKFLAKYGVTFKESEGTPNPPPAKP
jgi:predicted patatin/cPLA2 family phospholipase